MKKLLLLATGLLFAASAGATLLVEENFNDTAGNQALTSGGAFYGTATYSASNAVPNVNDGGYSGSFPGIMGSGVNLGTATGANAALANLTVSMWVNLNSHRPTSVHYLQNYDGGNGFIFYADGFGNLKLYVNGVVLVDDVPFGLNQWVFIAATFDDAANTADLWIGDGTTLNNAMHSGPFHATLVASTKDLVIGDYSAGDRAVDGLIDDVRVYDTTLSSAELTTLMQTGVPSIQVGWSVNTSDGSSPLRFTDSGTTLGMLTDVGPEFDGWAQGPGSYSVSVIEVTTENGYTVMKCRASSGGNTAVYSYSFKQLADGALEMLVEADETDPEYVPITGFDCGTITGGSGSFKQFYLGQRVVDAYPANYGVPAHVYWPAKGIYFYGSHDMDWGNANGRTHKLNPKSFFSVSNPPLSNESTYRPLSDGTHLPLKERFVFRANTDMWEAFGPMTNAPSEYKEELAEMLFLDDWSVGFDFGNFQLSWLKDIFVGKLPFYTIIQIWGNVGFDTTNPDHYRIPDHDEPAEEFGTKQQLIDYVNLGKTVGRIGLRCNYMWAEDASWSIQEGLVKKAIDKDGNVAWHTDFDSVRALAIRQETDIQTDFVPNATFHDQWTSGLPINYDVNTAGAGSIAAHRQMVREICETARTTHAGPMGSESMFEEYLIGQYCDTGDFGVMSADDRFDFIPEYKLRRLHDLTTFHGMGLGYRFFYGPWDNSWQDLGNIEYFLNDEALDRYRACQVLYGNGAYLFGQTTTDGRYGLRKVHALTECFTVGVVQRYYALQTLDYLKYGKAGQWKEMDEILPLATSLSDMQSWFKKFHVRYQNGCHVWVNRDSASNFDVTLPDSSVITLPQGGWAVYTEDGNVVAYTALAGSNRVDFCEDTNRGIKYANPRLESSFKGVSLPTVWFDGQVHYELEKPNELIADEYRRSKVIVPVGKAKGDVLSWFNSDETEVYGLDVRGLVGTDLHVMAGDGKVYKYDIDAVSKIKDGSQGAYDAKEAMMDPGDSARPMRGLLLKNTWEGSFASVYLTLRGDNRELYRSIWGVNGGDPGSMTWSLIKGANFMRADGDATPTSRRWGSDIWTTYSVDDTLNRYPYSTWGGITLLESIQMPKDLQGVSLGDDGELWVLCTDREVLRISDSDGAILDRFYLDATIVSPWGIAYDPKVGLWISDANSQRIYQIATTAPGGGPLEWQFIAENNTLAISWDKDSAGSTYALQSKTNLMDSVWENIIMNIAGTTRSGITVTTAVDQVQSFYRVRVEE